MAIQISGTTVIDNSRNYTNISNASTSQSGTKSWTSGLKTINLTGSDGNIKIDGTLTASSLAFYLA
jgi:hypothetical protein